MTELALPVLFAVFVWWLATGILLYLHRLPSETYRWSMLGMTVLAGAALYGHVISSGQSDLVSAYLAFTCGVVIWGWLEMGYFTGLLVGPHKEPCPASCTRWRRFALAVQTGLFHDIAIVVTCGVLVATAWSAPNQIGVWSFVVLWLMRWSAKLNLYLGVPNLNEHWLPEHMRFVSTYMAKRSMNLLFPMSVTVAAVVLGFFVQVAFADATLYIDRVGLLLVSSLLVLGILEHWFLVLPFSEEALWRWALRSPKKGRGTGLQREPGVSGSDETNLRHRRSAGRSLSEGRTPVRSELVEPAP